MLFESYFRLPLDSFQDPKVRRCPGPQALPCDWLQSLLLVKDGGQDGGFLKPSLAYLFSLFIHFIGVYVHH